MTQRRGRRRTVIAWIVAMACGLALLGGAAIAPASRAARGGLAVTAVPTTDQGAFEQACKQGGGTYKANPDGSFQCTSPSGTVVSCQDAQSQCTLSQTISGAEAISLVGGPQGAPNATAAPAIPTSSTGGQIIGGVGETPTPRRPGVPGGISIAPINGAKAPPAASGGNGSGSAISLTPWTCPGYATGTQSQLQAVCDVDNTVAFEITGANGQTFPHGRFAETGLPAGFYRIREYVPSGYGVAYAFCGLAATGSQPPQESPIVVYDGYYEFTLEQNQSITCDWYNLSAQGNRSGIEVTLRDCPIQPPLVPRPGPGTPLPPPQNCSSLDNVTSKVQFVVSSPYQPPVTIHGGGILMQALPPGQYTVQLSNIPTGYGNPTGYCAFAPTTQQAPLPNQPITITNGSYTFALDRDQTIYCDWYIVSSPSRAPVKQALATSAPGVGIPVVPAAAASPIT